MNLYNCNALLYWNNTINKCIYVHVINIQYIQYVYMFYNGLNVAYPIEIVKTIYFSFQFLNKRKQSNDMTCIAFWNY